MSSAVVELDNLLSSMLALKAGVSGQKIAAITTLCNINVKDEPVLIQKIYAHFKKAEPTKKLGVLYVIDSVSRQWVGQTRKTGQEINHGARDGTYAAGVMHVSELLPALMQDIINVMPDEQREKVSKLITIWEKDNTFHPTLLHSFREKLDAPAGESSDTRFGQANGAVQSTTPTSTPPPQALLIPEVPKPEAQPAQSTSSILASLQALAAASKNAQQQAAPAPPIAPVPVQYQAPVVPVVPVPPPVNPVSSGVYGAAIPPPLTYSAGVQAPPPPPPPIAAVPQDPAFQQQLVILQTLQAQGIPQSEWPRILAALAAQSGAAPIPPPNFIAQHSAPAWNATSTTPAQQGNHNGVQRSRSRSPRHDGNSYDRRRSPDRRGGVQDQQAQNSQLQNQPGNSKGPIKRIDFDRSLPVNHIKVFSRTLFVGGVERSTEQDLRDIFSKAGMVQTCTINTFKRHAFVKLSTHQEAQQACKMYEFYDSGDVHLRTKWGVGFGPRDAFNYEVGVSLIPLDRLTDVDLKWLVTAEYGGTGGREVEPFMCVDEPDIEIGEGMSSKSLSRRMVTDKSGAAGPRSSRQRDQQMYQQKNFQQQSTQRMQQNYQQQNRGHGRRRHEHRGNQVKIDTAPNVQAPPAVPGFGFQMPFTSS